MRSFSGIGSRTLTVAAGIVLFFLILAVSPAGAVSPAVVSIAAANSTSLALLDDGTVWQWGYASGAGDWTTPQRIDIAGVRQIAAGDGHILALKSDGTVWAWGANRYGQLGDGTYNDSLGPVQVTGLAGVTAIGAGKAHSIAMKGDGTVWAWGSNSYGQVGQNSLSYGGSAVPVQVKGLNNIKAISGRGNHNLALQNDGTVWAWGENFHGILGDGTNVSRETPSRSGIRDLKAFDAGQSGHALAVRSDGNVWSWGYNYKGQLGRGEVSLNDQGRLSYGPEADSYSPDIVRGIANAKAVAAGASHSVALADDGTVWAWGSNSDGQLGQGIQGGRDTTAPVQVGGLDRVTAISAGTYHTLALKGDGSVWAWGSGPDGQIGNGTAASAPVLVLMGAQIPPPAPSAPVVAATAAPPAPVSTATPAGGMSSLLLGAIGLLVVIVALIAAYLLVFRKREKNTGKKGL